MVFAALGPRSRVCVALTAGALCGCPAREGPRDAEASIDGADAAVEDGARASGDAVDDRAVDVVEPQREITAGDARGSIVVGNGPRALRLRGAGGDAVLEGASRLPWLELGARRGGVSRTSFHDVRSRRPAGVTWVAPSRLVADPTGGMLVARSPDGVGGDTQIRVSTLDEGVYSVQIEADASAVAMLRVNLAADDGAYVGFGERFGGTDARGAIVPMQMHLGGTDSGTNEVHVPVPFFVNSRGYGLFVRTRYAGAFDVAASDRTVVSATFEASSLELVFFVDPDPIRVIERFTRLSGLPRLPPYWAHGHMQWRNAWRSREELLEDAQRLRTEGIPTTTIWIDNPWQVSYNDAVIDEARFRDPPSMFAALRSLGYRVLVWHTPYLDAIDADGVESNTAERLFGELRARGHLVRQGDPPLTFVSPSNTGNPGGMQANGGIVDFTIPAARALWVDRLRPIIEFGVRAFKLDYGEDILHEVALQRPLWGFGEPGALADPRTAPSLFSHWYHQAYREAIDRFAGGDGFLLVRASSWGGQRVCDIVWPGDLDNDFRPAVGTAVGGLPAAVSALINLSASGFPSFASDTGGYRGGRPTREALLRWAEHSALAPYMQLGGGGESHNPWSYDAEATVIYRTLARLHDGLIPYWRSLAIAASTRGTPPIRALALSFPQDSGARSDPYAYLLGDDLYAVPVIEPGVTRRRVHIPPGRWVHWFTRVSYEGPRDEMLDAPLGQPLLFLRHGAVVPMLAEDVVTLASTDDATIVDAEDRRMVLRARIVPGEERASSTHDGARIVARSVEGVVSVRWTPGSDATELRAQIDWANRAGATGAAPTSVVLTGGTAVSQAPSLDDARQGRCAPCWAYSEASGELYVTVRGAAAWSAQ